MERKLPLLFEDPPAGSSASSRGAWRGLAIVVLIFVATRLLVWSATYYGAFMNFRIEHQIDPPLEQHTPRLIDDFAAGRGPAYQTATRLLGDLMPLCRFDGLHYKSIIEGGYQYETPRPGETRRDKLEQNIAFFPLFPMIVRPLSGLMSTNVAMVLVVHVCTLLAGVLLYFWTRWRVDETSARFAVALLYCFPSSVYFSYAYAESVTLVLFVAALWLMDRRVFWAAAVVCALATATRPTALSIAVVLALAYWLNSERARGQRLARLVPLGLVAGLGIAGYAAFLTYQFGSPLVYIANFKAGWVPDHQRADWVAFLTFTPVFEQFKYFRDLVMFAPPIGLANAPNTLMWNMPLSLLIVFVSLAGMMRAPRSFRPLLLLGPLIFLHSYLASGGAKFGIEPIARYMAVAVPAFVILAAWCTKEWRNGARTAMIGFFLVIEAAWAFRFGLLEWSG